MNKNTYNNDYKDLDNEDRRVFLKKTKYIAPTIILLGTLLKPTSSNAGFGTPPSGPTWN